jgi:hypothetical protein
MSSVKPSVDHVRSVKVAQCRLLTIHRGVCCCVSYKRTESSVATAYTIRYGNEKAIVGPCVFAFVSTSKVLTFGDEVGPEGAVVWGIGGGGSIIECAGDFGTTGSGSSAIVSSADEVSIVIFFVCGGVLRGV